MIGKPEWFKFRYNILTGQASKSSMIPGTWQGWLYMAVILGGVWFFIKGSDFWTLAPQFKKTFGLVWGGIFTADIIHIYIQKLKSED